MRSLGLVQHPSGILWGLQLREHGGGTQSSHPYEAELNALWWLHDAAGFCSVPLEEDEVDAAQQGYSRSCCMVLMQALLLSPRQLSSSNYLLWVPPRVKLSLGFVSQTSKDLPGKKKSPTEKLASLLLVRWSEGMQLAADLRQKTLCRGHRSSTAASAWAPKHHDCGFRGVCVTYAMV